ncbi:MAG: hypothetical protein ACK4MQ_12690 [Hyphomonas sp.]
MSDAVQRSRFNWTASIALLISVFTLAYNALLVLRGPQIEVYPFEQAFIFGYSPGEDGSREFGVLIWPQVANVSASQADIIRSHSVHIKNKNGNSVCLSPRGTAQYSDRGEAPGAVESVQIGTESRPMFVSMFSSSSILELPPGRVVGHRHLFDQLASRSAADVCHKTIGERLYTVEDFISEFAEKPVQLDLEMDLSRGDGWVVSCIFDFNPRRVELLRDRGHLNATCESIVVERKKSGLSFWGNVNRRLGSVF